MRHLQGIDINTTTPIDALEMLQKLQQIASEGAEK
jgi:hypothetical protein